MKATVGVLVLAFVRLVPLITTVAPMGPLVIFSEVIVGAPTTVKLVELVAVPPVVVTEIEPVVAPTGTTAEIWVGDTTVTTVADTPLKATVGVIVVALIKLVPLIVTVVPTEPDVGLKLATLGTGTTVKLPALVAVPPLVVAVTVPVCAPAGTMAVTWLEETTVTVDAATPPKSMVGLAVFVLVRLAPLIVTVVPIGPVTGVNEAMLGAGNGSERS